MQVAARIAIRAVVQLVRVESRMNRLCRAIHIGHERIALFVGQIDNLAHVVFIRDNAAAGMALLFEENQRADVQFTDDNAERIQQLAAIRVFHGNNLLSI